MNDFVSKPILVEPGIKYFLNKTLIKCNEFKKTYYNYVFNIGVAVALFSAVAVFLYYKYKGKPSPMQLALKEREKQHYILSKIKNYHDDKRRRSQENITGLPRW